MIVINMCHLWGVTLGLSDRDMHVSLVVYHTGIT